MNIASRSQFYIVKFIFAFVMATFLSTLMSLLVAYLLWHFYQNTDGFFTDVLIQPIGNIFTNTQSMLSALHNLTWFYITLFVVFFIAKTPNENKN